MTTERYRVATITNLIQDLKSSKGQQYRIPRPFVNGSPT